MTPGSCEALDAGCPIGRGDKTGYVYGCRCDECRKAATTHNRTWRQTATGRASRIRSLATNKAWRKRMICEIKMVSGCMDCGFSGPPEALQFDHVRGVKKFTISGNLNFAWERILSEIEKCEVVCANCHIIRTTARARARYANPASDEAASAGCLCCPTDNNHGHGVKIGGVIRYWRNEHCPLHGEADVIELSIETT